MYPYCYFNGRVSSINDIQIPLNDLGLLRGYAIFEFLRTYNHEPFLLSQYLERFIASAKAMRLPIDKPAEELQNDILELIAKNKINEDVGIRMILTGGASTDNMSLARPTLYILIEPLYLPAIEQFQSGIKLIKSEYLRPFPAIKTTNYIQAIYSQPEMRLKNAADVLYCFNSQVLETTRSNFFIVKNRELITPLDNILIGRTRNFAIQLAGRLNIKVSERTIDSSELADADEAFITGTTKKILPVVEIDDMKIGNGKPGKLTFQLLNLFNESIGNVR